MHARSHSTQRVSRVDPVAPRRRGGVRRAAVRPRALGVRPGACLRPRTLAATVKLDMTTLPSHNTVAGWLGRLRAKVLERPVELLHLCGTHERVICDTGLRDALPATVNVVAGPGCPLCVCPEEDLQQAIRLAVSGEAVVVAYAELLRIPVHVGPGQPCSLEEARGAGAEVIPISTAIEALVLARSRPHANVVFLLTGFELGLRSLAALLAHGLPSNLYLMLALRRLAPALEQLLASGDPAIDGVLLPSHLVAVTGLGPWRRALSKRGVPGVVIGFEPSDVLGGIHDLVDDVGAGRRGIDSRGHDIDSDAGRDQPDASTWMRVAGALEVTDAFWRGLGVIPDSGYRVQSALVEHDARPRFVGLRDEARASLRPPPTACDCGAVLYGKRRPVDCALFGISCHPGNPVGPCMVSEQGVCRIWWAQGRRARAAEALD